MASRPPRQTRPTRKSARSGFSLLQTSIILMMAAMVMVSLLPGRNAGDQNQKLLDSIAKLNKVEDGMERFMAQKGRRPCPADGQYDVNDSNFGREAGETAANAPAGSCKGGTPAVSMGPDAGTGYIVAGTIPTKTLGLPDDYAFDAWGRRFTYRVDTRATETSSCYQMKEGGLQVKAKDPTGAVRNTDNVMYAYIIHGPGGYGAWPAQGSTLADRVNTGIADADKQNNAGVDASFTYNTTNFTNVLYSKDHTKQFDDTVYYIEALKNTCCLGQACNSSAGFESQGDAANNSTGSHVVSLDINGDGLTDIAMCAPNASPGGRANAGSVYIVFGTRSELMSGQVSVTTLNGSNGLRIDGENANDHLCSSVASGDINGDDINDLIIGATGYNSNEGATYVVLGGTGNWPASFTVDALAGSGNPNGSNGFRIDGEAGGDQFGYAVASRDFNGDDFDDLIVGAPQADGTKGKGYMICGGGGAWPGNFSVSGLSGIPNAVGTCGFSVTNSGGTSDQLGYAAAMGNLTGDSYADAVFSAPYAQVGPRPEAGKNFVICGTSAAFPATLDVSALAGIPNAAGTCGAEFDGVATNHHAGYALDIGDMNGDGIMDLIIGAPNANPMGRVNAGSVYVVYGNDTGFAATFDLNTVNYASTGFRIDGKAGDTAGSALYGRCDFNGDGIMDLIIGAPNMSPLARLYAGGAYAVFGTATALSTFDVTNLNGNNGFAIYGATAGDNAGFDVGSADNYNFGLCNILIGAPNVTVGGNASAGQLYTIMGSHDWTTPYDLSTMP